MTWFCDESCILILYYFAMCVMNVIYNWLLSAGLSVPLHAVWTSWCGPQYVKMISLTVCPAPMYGRRDVDCSPSRRFPWVFRRSGGSCYRQLWSTPRQQSGRAPMLGRVYSCKEQRQMYMSRNAQQTAFTLCKPPGGCSDVACITSTIVCVVHERNATKSLTIIRTRPAAVKRICINTHVRMTLVPWWDTILYIMILSDKREPKYVELEQY